MEIPGCLLNTFRTEISTAAWQVELSLTGDINNTDLNLIVNNWPFYLLSPGVLDPT